MKQSQMEKGTADLKRTFVRHPRLQSKVKFSASEASGAVSLGWYRGQHTGWFDSYKILRKEHPEAAAFLLDRLGMNKNGSIG